MTQVTDNGSQSAGPGRKAAPKIQSRRAPTVSFSAPGCPTTKCGPPGVLRIVGGVLGPVVQPQLKPATLVASELCCEPGLLPVSRTLSGGSVGARPEDVHRVESSGEAALSAGVSS